MKSGPITFRDYKFNVIGSIYMSHISSPSEAHKLALRASLKRVTLRIPGTYQDSILYKKAKNVIEQPNRLIPIEIKILRVHG